MKKILKIALLCLCAFSFCCVAAIGDDFLSDDLDPASILDEDSSQSESILIAHVLPNIYDIQTLATTGRATFNNTLATLAPVTNFVAEVKNEQLRANQSIRATNNDPNKQNITPTPVISLPRRNEAKPGPPPSVFRPPSSTETDDLKVIIEQIRSISLGPEKQAKTAVEPVEEIAEPNEIVTVETPPVSPPALEIKTETASSLLSSHVIQQVDNLIKEPNRIVNPLELAEILFKSGMTAQAAVCYKQALSKTAADDVNTASERAWILFQIGNCLKFDDPNTARESFSQLLTTYPESPWAQAAKTSRDLTDWLQQEQPQKLIGELKK